METTISVEVHATQPNWIEHELSGYRIYVNDDLITERTWVWDINTFIDENIIVDLSPNITHNIRVDPAYVQRGVAKFSLSNLRVNNMHQVSNIEYGKQLSFIIA